MTTATCVKLLSSKMKPCSIDTLVDHEAAMHSSSCKRLPSSCYCNAVHWIWAIRPGRDDPVNSGKWMLFVRNEHVDPMWKKVLDLLALGKLGSSAKVAPASGANNKAHLICIYTEDHEDVADVFRVLVGIRESQLSLIAIHYKTDEATLEGTYATSSAAVNAGFGPPAKKPKNFRVSKYSSPKVAGTASEMMKSIKLYLNNIGPQYRQGVIAEFVVPKKDLKRKFEEVEGTSSEQVAPSTSSDADLVVTIHNPPRDL